MLVDLLPVFTELFADVPLGGLETGPIRWEINGYDLWYETLEQVGGAHHLVLLRAPDGMPELIMSGGDGDLASVWGSAHVVLATRRGASGLQHRFAGH